MSLYDIAYFVIIFCYTTLGFGFFLFITDSKRNYNLVWLEAFGLNFGNADLGSEFDSDTWLNYIVFFVATIVNVVLMLNLLISILGDSYDRFQMNQVQFDYEERAELILEVLIIRSAFSKIIGWVEGEYIHVCLSPDQTIEEVNDSWEGKLRFMNTKSDKNNKALKEKVDSIQNTIEKVFIVIKEEINQKIETARSPTKRKIEGMETERETIEFVQEEIETVHEEIETVQEGIETVKEGIKTLQEGINQKIEGMETVQEGIKKKIESIEGMVQEGINQKVEGINQKIEGINQKIEGMETVQEGIKQKISSIEEKLEIILSIISK
jgi:prefoldin subunit 5